MSDEIDGPSPEEMGIDPEDTKTTEVSESDKITTPEDLRNKLLNPDYLPKRSELSSAFTDTTYESGERFDWFLRNNINEILTREYIEEFGQHITQRVGELGGTEDQPVIILEVGAGDGRLTHFLKDQVETNSPDRTRFVATDTEQYGIAPKFPVETLSGKRALEKFKPNIVVCSWMPRNIDLSSDMRATPSVQEYILIGIPDADIVGDKWDTWGKPRDAEEEWHHSGSDTTSIFERSEPLPEEERAQVETGIKIKYSGSPPYEKEGFQRFEMENLSKLQSSKTRFLRLDGFSKTVSFRKNR